MWEGAQVCFKLLINMKKSALFTIFLFMGAFATKSFGIGLTEVELQDISSSGKSLVIDRGNLEEYKEGLLGRFYLQKGPKEFPKVFLVAEGELVKSFPRKSYWLLKKVHIPKALVRDSKVFIATSNELLQGRELRVKNKHVVMSDKEYRDVDDYLDKNQKNVPKRLVKEDQGYEPSADIFEKEELTEVAPGTDVLLTTYENYKNKSGNYYSEEYGDLTAQHYFIGNKEVALGDIKKAEDKKLFDSISDGYEKKTNGMKYGIKSFYREQGRTPGVPEISEKGGELSTYARMKEEQKIADQIDPKAMAKMNRDGEHWSADMDDAALRRYFIKTGMEKEIRRRNLALNELEGHEIMFHYSGSMIAHGNTQDPNYQGRGYSLGIAYDLHLARTSENLKKWSLQFFLERGVTEYDTGEFNARSEETDYGAYLNYYFINNPLTLNSFIYLAGVGFKNGSATVSSPDISNAKDYSYQLLSPSFQLMTKYRFRSGDLNEDTVNVGMSLNFGINVDMKSLSIIDRVDDNINSKISVTDLKYILGMSVYF